METWVVWVFSDTFFTGFHLGFVRGKLLAIFNQMMARRDANGGVFGCRFRAVLVGPHGHGGLSGIWVLEGGDGPPRPEATLIFMLRSVFGGTRHFP